jgi:hypothetical protein
MWPPRSYRCDRISEYLFRNLSYAVMDWDAGPITQFPLAGHPELEEPLARVLKIQKGLHSIKARPGLLTLRNAFAITIAGVPGIALLQNSSDYDRVVHSTSRRSPYRRIRQFQWLHHETIYPLPEPFRLSADGRPSTVPSLFFRDAVVDDPGNALGFDEVSAWCHDDDKNRRL